MNAENAEERCPHCAGAVPRVWDGVLAHYAHLAVDAKLMICHEPWRDRSDDTRDPGKKPTCP